MRKIICILILLTVFFVGCSTEILEFETVEKGAYSYGHPDKKNYVIQNLDEWKLLWNKTHEGRSRTPELPIIDFNSEMVIGVYMGIDTYSFEIKKATIGENQVKVIVEEEFPGKSGDIPAVVTKPYHIIKIKKIDKEVIFIEN